MKIDELCGVLSASWGMIELLHLPLLMQCGMAKNAISHRPF